MKQRLKFPLLRLALLACVSTTAAECYAATARASGTVGENLGRRYQKVIGGNKSRTPEQKKIDSQLLYALMQRRGETSGVPAEPVRLDLDVKGRALVDVSGDVSARLLAKIRKLGGEVISKSETYHNVRARLSLEKLEELAGLKEVRFIAPAAKAMTNGGAFKH